MKYATARKVAQRLRLRTLGRRANLAGVRLKDCPYKDERQVDNWRIGWLRASKNTREEWRQYCHSRVHMAKLSMKMPNI